MNEHSLLMIALAVRKKRLLPLLLLETEFLDKCVVAALIVLF